MPIPPYILALRAKVGNDLLFMPGVRAIVVNDRGQVLLNRRSDNGEWSAIEGVLEPGEEPGQAIVREVKEETGVDVVVERLVGVTLTPIVEYANGDRTQYLSICFRCRPVGNATPRVNDDESFEVAYMNPDQLPPVRPDVLRSIRYALSGRVEADFVME
ncbi:MAG: NUDIX domain-containing protein [Tepidisphaeraceae bacterium]